MSFRLLNLFVKSIAAVKKPANKRPFLIIKAATEGRTHMRAKTFEECLKKWQAPTPTSTVMLTKADIDHINNALEQFTPAAKAARSATDEVEARIAQRIDRNPVSVTRAVAMQEVFTADPALYDRYRAENTVGRDGQVLDRNPSAHNEGRGRVAVKAETASVEAEVERRLDGILAKESRLTRAQAMQFAFRQDPALYERWRAAYA